MDFNITSLFDDTTYKCDEILNLNVDEGNEKFYVGNVFWSKEDCQISLLIYFKQMVNRTLDDGTDSKEKRHRVAAGYKSKFVEPLNTAKLRDLQRLVLEDFRLSASYMKC
ncbi:hypothetical protein HID58_093796 [Brassica napus]|uniref:PiggyBac transposable element-derived protein domain-containing protein n=1 Tax=Brassica napus TaxID=3708 RepID=A0ABQ7X9T8_BRANA|nr:hypothetical protein HID58_093796 [Brassica napus]